MQSSLMTPAEAAELLRTSEAEVLEMARGELSSAAIRLGSRVLFRRVALRELAGLPAVSKGKGRAEDDLLSVDDVAALLNVPVRTAYERMRTMRHVRLGRSLRVAPEALSEYIAACSIAAKEQTGLTAKPTGRASTASVSRPVARTSGQRRSGDVPENEKEPIHVSQPRKWRA